MRKDTEMELNDELLAKARAAKSPEELLALAKENNAELTEEEAKTYFDQLHPRTGELSDDELDNVAGGACYARIDKTVVSAGQKCQHYFCRYCGGKGLHKRQGGFCAKCRAPANCETCQYCTHVGGVWRCNDPARMK